MPGTPSPFVAVQYFDDDGDPAAGYQLFTYDTNTTTKRNTFTDYDLTVANTNPIILDSAGRATIFLSPVLYTFVLAPPTDTDPPVAPIWTRHNVVPSGGTSTDVDVSVTAGESIAVGDCCYLSDGSGALTAGRWYKADADQTYSSNAAFMFGFATSAIASAATGTVRICGRVTGLTGLVAGTPYFVSATAGALTSTAPTNAAMVGKADTTTSLILPIVWGDAGAAVRGVVSTGAQTFAGQKTFVAQPQTYIGAATTLPAYIGGVYFTDVVTHTVVAGSTDTVMSDTEIPANMLNADGKSVHIRVGASTDWTGANTKTVEIDVGGTQIALISSASALTAWGSEVFVIRIDSDSVDVAVGLSSVTRINGLSFTAAIDLRTLGTTGAGSTLSQDFFSVEAVG